MSASPEVLGPYVILERIGRGGMATVHRAEQQGFGGFTKQVALKRLHPHIAADPAMLRSFVHEARLASHLHHANVAQTYDLGEVDSTYFIAMEYVPGPTLMQVMHQCRDTAGPMPMPIVMAVLIQVCDALDHAHFLCDDSGKPLGIIHRDVSPSNVIVSNTGIVKLIDFGIAKAANSGVQTQVGYIKGKFGYVAPEYLEGQLDARADLFGVGVIAHELMTGRPLFQGADDFETLTQVRDMPIIPPSRFNREVTPDIDDIVMTALQRDPTLRWQSAGAMRTAIANAGRDLGIVAGNAQVLEWTQWAFAQGSRDAGNKKLARVIAMLSEPSTATAQLSASQAEVLDRLEPKTKSIAKGSTGGRSAPGRAVDRGETRRGIGDDGDTPRPSALGSVRSRAVRAESEIEVEVVPPGPFDGITAVGEVPALVAATARRPVEPDLEADRDESESESEAEAESESESEFEFGSESESGSGSGFRSESESEPDDFGVDTGADRGVDVERDPLARGDTAVESLAPARQSRPVAAQPAVVASRAVIAATPSEPPSEPAATTTPRNPARASVPPPVPPRAAASPSAPPSRPAASMTGPPPPPPRSGPRPTQPPAAVAATPAIVVKSAMPMKTMLGVGDPALPRVVAGGADPDAVGAMAAAETADAPAQPAAQDADAAGTPSTETTPTRKRRLWWILIILALLMVAAGVATYYSLPELGYGTLDP